MLLVRIILEQMDRARKPTSMWRRCCKCSATSSRTIRATGFQLFSTSLTHALLALRNKSLMRHGWAFFQRLINCGETATSRPWKPGSMPYVWHGIRRSHPSHMLSHSGRGRCSFIPIEKETGCGLREYTSTPHIQPTSYAPSSLGHLR
jgi:hypothetical protein